MNNTHNVDMFGQGSRSNRPHGESSQERPESPRADRADLGKISSQILKTDPEFQRRVISRERANEIRKTILGLTRGGGETLVILSSVWHQTLRWARNSITLAGDRQRQVVIVMRKLPGYDSSIAITNQLDKTSLENVVRAVEARSVLEIKRVTGFRLEPFMVAPPELRVPELPLWSDATTHVTASQRAKLAAMLNDKAAEKGFMSAGAIQIRIASHMQSDDPYEMQYALYTQAECSATVRHTKGMGSGWAGEAGFDWSRLNIDRIGDRALDKCVESLQPARIEPGRYTVVLEPQATYDLVSLLFASGGFGRMYAEDGQGPYALGRDPDTRLGMTKLGMKIVDERVTISHDPTEPGLAIYSKPGMAPITWIDRGVLRTLVTGADIRARLGYSLPMLNESIPEYGRGSFRMSGGEHTLEEMIATTKRGLLVTRFSNIIELDERTKLATGYTRDGLWLIESGKISKPVYNFRFTESPLYALNRLVQMGPPVPVFRRLGFEQKAVNDPETIRSLVDFTDILLGPQNAVVPPIKVDDFSMVSLVDAV